MRVGRPDAMPPDLPAPFTIASDRSDRLTPGAHTREFDRHQRMILISRPEQRSLENRVIDGLRQIAHLAPLQGPTPPCKPQEIFDGSPD